MLKDIKTVIWKEWRDFFFQQSIKSKIQILVFISIAGIYMPLKRGDQWFNETFFYGIAIIGPLLMVLTVICDLFAGENERHTLETILASRISTEGFILGKLVFAISYAALITMLLLFLNIITINLNYYNSSFIFPSFNSILIILIINFLLAFFGSVIGAIISLQSTTVKQAQLTLTISIILLAIIPSFILRYLSIDINKLISFYNSLGSFLSASLASVLLFLLGWSILTYIFWRFDRIKIIKH